MKKFYAVLTAAMAVSGAYAVDFVPFNGSLDATRNTAIAVPGHARVQRASAANLPSNMWGYSCDIASWSGFGQALTDFKMASKYDESLVKVLAGKKISQIGFVAPVLQASTSGLEMKLFITYDLDKDPVAEVTYTSTGSVVGQNGVTPKYDIVTLPTPVTIEEGKPFYVGVSAAKIQYIGSGQNARADYPVAFDGVPYPGGEGLLYTSKEMGQWQNGSSRGTACFYLGLDKAPENIVRVIGTYLPESAINGEQIMGQVNIFNLCDGSIPSLDMAVQLGSQAAKTFTASPDTRTLYYATSQGGQVGAVPGHTMGMGLFTGMPVDQTGKNVPLTVTLTKSGQNDIAWTVPVESSINVFDQGTGYKRNVVVEEFTGTWCPWCVRGIVGMEYMNKKYSDGSYIGIAVHAGDRMESDTYVQVANAYAGGFPSAMVNRYTSIDPNSEEIEESYKTAVAYPAYGKIDMTLKDIDKAKGTVSVETSSEFLYGGKYAVAYVVKENNVGPYTQQNAYAGGRYGEMGGFEKKGSTVSQMYDEVGRDIFGLAGLENSLPATVETGKAYTHSYNVSIANVGKKDNAYKIADTSIVAMIIDQENGVVVNAVEKKLSELGVAGIEADAASQVTVEGGMISAGVDADVYTVDGRRVARIAAGEGVNVDAGIYIVRAGRGAVKVAVK